MIDFGYLNKNETIIITLKLTSTEVSYSGKLKIEISDFPGNNAAETLICKANSIEVKNYEDGKKDQMYSFSQTETEQTNALMDYRYIGDNPNNYVKFNNELWRIIGVFPTEDETGKMENRVKLVRNTGIGNLPYNSTSYNNEWSTSTLNTLLNSGDYYNRTGNYSNIGITENSKKIIDKVKWYLGGSLNENASATSWYLSERSTKVYSGRITSIINAVGIIYISDYLYTYSNNIDNKCYEYSANCSSSNPVTGWIYNSNFNNNDSYATSGIISTLNVLDPDGTRGDNTFIINSGGHVGGAGPNLTMAEFVTRPTVYLKSSIKFSSGDGSYNKPYIFQE